MDSVATEPMEEIVAQPSPPIVTSDRLIRDFFDILKDGDISYSTAIYVVARMLHAIARYGQIKYAIVNLDVIETMKNFAFFEAGSRDVNTHEFVPIPFLRRMGTGFRPNMLKDTGASHKILEAIERVQEDEEFYFNG